MAKVIPCRNLLRATAVEVRTLGNLAVRYPFGLMGDEAPKLRPSGDTPILLVHGFGANKSCFGPLRRSLREAGHRNVSAFNYNPLRNDLHELGAQLATEVARVRRATGAQRVHLVGHSLGGLLIRYYVTHLDGARFVDTAVTIGSPHGGSAVGLLGLLIGRAGRAARQVIPGSHLLGELEALSHKASSVTWVAYHASADVIVPDHRARLRHDALRATNIAVDGVGHLALLTHASVVKDVAGRLSRAIAQAA